MVALARQVLNFKFGFDTCTRCHRLADWVQRSSNEEGRKALNKELEELGKLALSLNEVSGGGERAQTSCIIM